MLAPCTAHASILRTLTFDHRHLKKNVDYFNSFLAYGNYQSRQLRIWILTFHFPQETMCLPHKAYFLQTLCVLKEQIHGKCVEDERE